MLTVPALLIRSYLTAKGSGSVSESGIEQVIRENYEVLGLVSDFTVGPKDVRAWTIHRGWKAPKAASVIHTDFEKGFIRAEVIAYDDSVAHRGEQGCRSARVLRVEAKEYVLQLAASFHDDVAVCRVSSNRCPSPGRAFYASPSTPPG